MTLGCKYDIGDCTSDCKNEGCLKTASDEVCDSACNISYCGYDYGDCGYCAPGCTLAMLLDNICQPECNTFECDYDNYRCDCNTGCTYTMLGDKICQMECNIYECGYDRLDCNTYECNPGCSLDLMWNYECDQVCNFLSCNYDAYNCLCSPSCMPIKLGDGICNPECNFASCAYDNGDCGKCASGCFENMINNGVCDPNCNIFDCGYDGNDCLSCAPGCLNWEKGSCKAECNVMSCDFNPGCTDWYLRRLSFIAQVSSKNWNSPINWKGCNLGNSCYVESYYMTWQCDSKCNNPSCYYGSGMCTSNVCGDNSCWECWNSQTEVCFYCSSGYKHVYDKCVASCPKYYTLTVYPVILKEICVPILDASTKENPELIYVIATSDINGDGSANSPYNNLDFAIATVMLKHSIIYLLGQTHNFNYLVDDGTITASPSRPLKRDNNPIISLVVKPFYCSQSLIPGCHTPGEKVRINVQSKIFQLDISGKVKFENIVFDGSDTFLNCDQCSYCRAVYYEDDFYTDDKGKSIDEGLFVPQKSCDEFASVSFFSLESTGILTLKSVNFQNFRQQYKALIYNQGGILNLYDVNFYNFMSKPKSGAIVSVPCSNSYCGEIHYINGSIQLLNNGYEITDEIDLSSFMKLNMLRWLEIDGITAKYNIVHKQTSDSDNRSMFELSKVLNISVINSKFDHNYAYNGLFYIDQKEMSMPTEINSQRQLIYHNLKNVIFESNSFKNNSAHTTAILNVEYNKDLQNVLMSQNLFLNNVGTSSGLIIFSNKGHLKNEYITGENRLIRLVGTSRTLVSFPSRTLTFSGNNFTQNSYDDDALKINNFANVVINGNSWYLNGQNPESNINIATIQDLTSISDIYLTLLLDGLKKLECEATVSITSTNNLQYDNNSIQKSLCESKNAGLTLHRTLNLTIIKDSEFIDNQCHEGGAALVLETSSIPTLKNLKFIRNKFLESAGEGVVSLYSTSSSKSYVFSDCTFEDNDTPIYAYLIQDLTIENCQFISAHGSTIGFLNFEAKIDEYSTLSIKNTKYLNNKQGDGHILLDSAGTKSTIKLRIEDSEFINSSGGESLLYISDSISLDNSSVINNTRFIENHVTLIRTYIKAGTLTVNSSIFDRNVAVYGVVLYSEHASPAKIVFSDCEISNNEGDSIIHVTSNTGIPLLETYNCNIFNNRNNTILLHHTLWLEKGSYIKNNENYMGGAVVLETDTNADLENTIFEENLSLNDGGAIWITSRSHLVGKNVTLFNNTSLRNGGALSSDQSSHFIFTDSKFTHNKCKVRGSAINILNCIDQNSTVTNTEFSYNAAEASSVVVAFNGLFSMINSRVFNNTGETNAGLLLLYSDITVSDSYFSNHTGWMGGHIYVNVASKLRVYNSIFENAETDSMGGSFAVTESLFLLHGAVIRNTRSGLGGAIQCFSKSKCMIYDTIVNNSEASDSGGVIYLFDSTLVIENSHFSDFIGSAVDSSKSNSINITQTIFENGKNSAGAAVNCIACVDVRIKNSKFQDLSANYGGALAFDYATVSKSLYTVIIENSIFDSCRSLYGGAIYSKNMNIDILNSRFQDNNATDGGVCLQGEGGAMYMTSDNSVDISISDSSFFNNLACMSGGGIQWYQSKPEFLNITNSENNALYGNDVASFPVSLSLYNNKRLLTTSIPSAPGQYLEDPIIIQIIDHYGQVVLTENTSTCQLNVENADYSLAGKTKVSATVGIYNFSEIMVTGTPGTKVNILISSTLFQTASNDSKSDIDFELRNCIEGEALVSKSCDECGQGTYNLIAGEECQDCPYSAKCLGKTEIYPKAGYWRYSNLTDKILECPNPAACLGGISTNNPKGECGTGYYGNLCQSCQKGYSRNGEDECSKCPDPVTNSLILTGMVILALFIVFIMTRASIKSAYKPKSYTSVFFKIFMNYLQIVVLTASFNLDWPQMVLQFFSVQKTAGSMTDQIFSVDCYLEGNGTKPFFSKLIFMAVLPLLLMTVTMMFWVIYYICVVDTKYTKNKFLGSIVVQLFLIQPTLVKFNFSSFNCLELEAGQLFLRSDLEIKCWDEDHVFYSLAVTLPSILVWCIAVPTLCLWHLYKSRHLLNTLELKLQYGFLYLGFKDETYYWEFTTIYRKILIISCSVFMGNSSIPVQALTVFVIVICTFFVQFKIKPYATHQLNSLEARAILVSALTIYCGLFYLTKDITYAVKVILFLIIVIVNFIFLSYWISNMTGVGIAILYTKVRFLRRLLRGTRFEKWIISVAPIPITVTDENVDGTFYDSNLDKSYAKYHKSPDKTAEDSTVVPTIAFLTEDMSCLPHISNIETNYDEDRVERIEIPSSKIVLDGNLQDKSNK